ncbi:hypothetical protein ACIQB5_15870 [Streptomyces sp. NPDC088560]|uniref:hypothetical protein n=1 Tax=Streptomyces sp. NPDC088560 TaxID=3365868 RepID=UPI00380A4B74
MDVGEAGRLPAALSRDGRRWSTVLAERSVLGVVHNITSATRLLDLLSAFESDQRVQVFFTSTGSSALDEGTREFLASQGMLYVPWEDALSQDFDVAISTSRGGDLHRIPFPLICTPHGAGYNKTLAGSREQGAFGLTREWLVHDGKLIPSAIVLSHQEQLERLAEGCPEALPVAHVAGDPCLDQLKAGLAFRPAYRRALGLLPGQRLVVVSSTWGQGSVLGSPQTDVLRRTLAELPADEFRVLAAVHPNAWYGHGAWQMHSWLAPLIDAGLMLPRPETEVWKAALCAADFLVGDHGSLTTYGVALGIPCVLGAFRDLVVAPGSPMERLGEVLPRLATAQPLPAQLARAAQAQRGDPELIALRHRVTSEPGRSAALLRRLFYSWLCLPEPSRPAATRPIPVPSVSPVHERRLPHLPAMLVTTTSYDSGLAPGVRVQRFPAALQRRWNTPVTGAHLVADPDDPDLRWPRSADVLVLPHERYPQPEAVKWSDVAARFPGCGLIAVEEADQGCTVLFADDTRLRAHWVDRTAWVSCPLAASAVHAWAQMSPGRRHLRGTVRIEVRASDQLPPALLELAPVP